MMRYLPERKSLFDDMFDSMFNGSSFNSASALMRTDIREKDGKYLLDIDLPGYAKEDIKISLYNGNLTIHAEHNDTQEEKDAKGNILRLNIKRLQLQLLASSNSASQVCRTFEEFSHRQKMTTQQYGGRRYTSGSLPPPSPI